MVDSVNLPFPLRKTECGKDVTVVLCAVEGVKESIRKEALKDQRRRREKGSGFSSLCENKGLCLSEQDYAFFFPRMV